MIQNYFVKNFFYYEIVLYCSIKIYINIVLSYHNVIIFKRDIFVSHAIQLVSHLHLLSAIISVSYYINIFLTLISIKKQKKKVLHFIFKFVQILQYHNDFINMLCKRMGHIYIFVL